LESGALLGKTAVDMAVGVGAITAATTGTADGVTVTTPTGTLVGIAFGTAAGGAATVGTAAGGTVGNAGIVGVPINVVVGSA